LVVHLPAVRSTRQQQEVEEAGYALTTIYDHMHETGRVKTSYETFRRHVQRFIKAAPADTAPPTPKAATRSASDSPTTVPAVTPKPAVPAPASPPGEQAGKMPVS
ncbi:TraK family protein, partial [Pseudomonas aeruginosa]|uniref:TraK family protein n=2 Tax=Pseudomonas aeruginosa TaxID=287 RepID=UPI003F7DBE39